MSFEVILPRALIQLYFNYSRGVYVSGTGLGVYGELKEKTDLKNPGYMIYCQCSLSSQTE